MSVFSSTFYHLQPDHGGKPCVIHCPVTFPPSGSRRLLSGMGVPDIRGTQGTFTFYQERESADKATGGDIITVAFTGNTAASEVRGPYRDAQTLAL